MNNLSKKGLDSHLMELLQRQIHMQIVDSIHFIVQENFKISFRKRALHNKLLISRVAQSKG